MRNFVATALGGLWICAVVAGWAEALDAGSAATLERALGLGPSMRVLNALDSQDAAHSAPRVASLWIDLGLSQERQGRFDQAEASLLHAAQVDKRLLPAWTLANFYFRRSNEGEFWRWANVASARVYDDFRPLLRLCDALEQDPPLRAQ